MCFVLRPSPDLRLSVELHDSTSFRTNELHHRAVDSFFDLFSTVPWSRLLPKIPVAFGLVCLDYGIGVSLSLFDHQRAMNAIIRRAGKRIVLRRVPDRPLLAAVFELGNSECNH